MSNPKLYFDIGGDFAPLERGLSAVASRAAGMIKVATVASLGALSAAVLAVGKASVDAAADMETYETTLASLMGSTSAAAKRMDELVTAAAKTPFNLDDLVEAEINLQGLTDASETLLPGVIDLASAMQSTGYTVQQAALDMGKAWTQGAAGMEGDTAKIIKQMVETEAGVKATDLSIEEFRKHLLNVLNDGKFAGSAAKLSATFSGMVSNLQDAWSGFLRDVARSSDLFGNMKGVLAGVLSVIEQNRAEIKALATVVGGELWQGFRLAAQGAAFIADGIRSGVGTAYALAAAVDTSEAAIHRMQAATYELAGAMADAAGVSGARFRDFATLLGIESEKAAARAEEHFATAEQMRVGDLQYYGQVVDMLNAAEAASKGLAAAEDERTGRKKPGGPAASGDGGRADKPVDLTAEINAYAEFYFELEHMRDSETEKLDTWRVEQLQQARALTEAMLGNDEDYAALSGAIGEEYWQRMRDLTAGYYDDILKQERETAAEQRRIRISTATDALSNASDVLAGIADLVQAANAKQKAAYKALMIASAIMSAAAAVTRQYADLPLYAAIPASIAVGLTTAAQIATIAQAHQGYAPPSVAPDERVTRTLTDEAVLSRQTTREIGPQGLHALEFGGATPAPASYTLRVGRGAWREMVRMDERTGGPMTQRIAAERRTGVAPGMSGARAA